MTLASSTRPGASGVPAPLGAVGIGKSPDGQWLVMVGPGEEEAITDLMVVLNWFEDLRRRVPDHIAAASGNDDGRILNPVCS